MNYKRLRSWVDTVESGIVDQDLRHLSKLDMPSRDPIDDLIWMMQWFNMGQRGRL
jgi:hypothetical protein